MRCTACGRPLKKGLSVIYRTSVHGGPSSQVRCRDCYETAVRRAGGLDDSKPLDKWVSKPPVNRRKRR